VLAVQRVGKQLGFSSWHALGVLLAVLFFLAPNGMNRVGPGSPLPHVVFERLAMHMKPLFGTRVAAKCVDYDGNISYVDPDMPCNHGAARTDVFVVPQQNAVAGITPAQRDRAISMQPGTEAVAHQCSALKDLVRVIDEEARRPGPEARRDELLALQKKAREEQQRLLC
jgi:hypothetical protein